VYSIAIVIWEMVYRLLVGRHNRPYHEYPALQHDFQIIVQVRCAAAASGNAHFHISFQAAKGVRPIIPDRCPAAMLDLINSTWAGEPEARPTCDELIRRIEQLEKIYEDQKEVWDSVVIHTSPDAVAPTPVSTDGE